jgi:hypothetical protein
MKKITLSILSLTVIFTTLLLNTNSSEANSSAPPVSHAGAPLDNSGLTCGKSGCHSGSAVTQTTGVIAHDIPLSGFIGGTVYNFTVSMSGANAYGFELTPQSPTSNTGLGTWIAGPGTSVSTKYIRQSSKKTGVNAVWTFSWTAPITATTVTFYGAFNYANNNSTTSGDIIKTSSLSVIANPTGIESEKNIENSISIFPNPANNIVHILTPNKINNATIYSLEGKIIKIVSEQELASKTITVNELSSGVYFLQLNSNEKHKLIKFIKN